MITSAAMKNGFTGGLIVDFPNSKKAKKYFLFLMAGYSEEIAKEAEDAVMLPKARVDGEDYSDSESESDSNESDDSEMHDDDASSANRDAQGEEDSSSEGEETSERHSKKVSTIKKSANINTNKTP